MRQPSSIVADHKTGPLVLLLAMIASPLKAEEHNRLTADERLAGWKLLFNGESAAGWRGYKADEMPPGWKVIDGSLVRISGGGGGKGAGGGDDIITLEQYDDFELKLEWKIVDRAGNGGIILRASEDAATSWHTGPEMQILDNTAYPGRDVRQLAGACYGLYAPKRDVTLPRGEWNAVRVVANGPRIEHWLNGVRLLEYQLGDQDWKARVAKSKFREMERFHNPPMKGHICLQDHTARIEYRNIKIRTLPTHSNAQALEEKESAIVRFPAKRSKALDVWRITHDPVVRDEANYHNMQCWSPDGRYICYTHHGAANKDEYGNECAAEIHLFDLMQERDVVIDRGINPRWANRKPWLFYAKLVSADGPRNGRGNHQIWLDVASGRRTRIGYGIARPMGTDCGDRWLYGIWYSDEGHPRAVRIPIKEDSAREVLPGNWGVGYNSLNVNPTHPLIVSRDHNYDNYYFATPGTRDIPFKARHFFDHGLLGELKSHPYPIMNGAHFAWTGDGQYFLPGNGPLRGRKWDEPLPANIHLLANISVGDVCPCGFSGRWVCGSTGGGTGPLRIADLRSGEGRIVLPTHSFLCFPSGQDNSGPYDIDAKGSPDGTKIAFVSTYDLQHGPAAQILGGSGENEIRVDSTDGFPDSGELVNPAGFGGEVLRYESKTPTSFCGLTRGLYGTDAVAPFRTYRMLIAFESLLIPETLRHPTPLPARWMRDLIKDMDSPLMWQRQTDIYVAVVRRPDRPYLRMKAHQVELIPGENHWETKGYAVLRDGIKITSESIRSGESLTLPGAGIYTAVAVEWSGLQSRPSQILQLNAAVNLRALKDKPNDFAWTYDRYLVKGGEVSSETAKRSSDVVREIVHLYDGVVHREWLRDGLVTQRHDLNPQGKPIRRLYFCKGKLAKREYFDDDRHVSTETFDREGFITESIHGRNHWWYQRGSPQRFDSSSSSFVNEGDRWVRKR